MALLVLRIVFLVVAAGVAFTIVNSKLAESMELKNPLLVFVAVLTSSIAVVGIDIFWPRKRIETISCVYFGIVIGLFLTYMLGFALEPLFMKPDLQTSGTKTAIQLVTGVMICYLCISFLLQTR